MAAPKVQSLVKRYFDQLTTGCGRLGCPNDSCANGREEGRRLDPNAAALLALQLAQGAVHRFCADGPPFLHADLVRELVGRTRETRDAKPLVQEVAAVFSSAEALGQSFLLSNAELQQARRARPAQRLPAGASPPTARLLAQSADALRVSASELSGLNAQAVAECYAELLGLRSADVLAALMRAVESLLCKLHVALVAQPSFVRQGAAVRPFAVLMLNPLLLEPQYHKQVLLPLLSLVAALPPPCCTQLVRWWSLLPAALLQQMVAVCQQFITVRLYYTQRIDDAVVAVRRLLLRPVHPIKTTVRQCGRAHRSGPLPPPSPTPRRSSPQGTRVLGHLFTANERARDDGRRAPDDGLDYRCFYNDAVNQEVNLKEDYRRWKGARGEFSFCEHPFILEPASKSRVLMYDATAQMTHEFEGAILRSLFVGATSPYLVVKVRRTQLISDTLLQMSLRKDDLKKPLKVQFVGEEGIDEGGVQKEFFQLIMSQIFDVSYGMFEYDEDARVFWFNRSSLENEREFELIGVLLGVAIYNGVILDMRFPHVLYKKLMRQPLGLRDLKRAFPAIGRSLQALLDFDGDGASVESTFGLCMQVCYVEFGETKTRDLVPGGGEVPVTERNREQYVELYTRYLLEDAVARQFDAFLRGFHAVCGGDCLQLFRWEELELLICGSPFLDFGALERVAQYDDGYSREHPTIALLWEVIHELPLELQKKFLFFATGSDRVPIKGLGNLNFVISRNGADQERLPSAHTCFQHLLLPEYTTKERLRKQLLKAMQETEGFQLV